jgi:hypothetical protein
LIIALIDHFLCGWKGHTQLAGTARPEY